MKKNSILKNWQQKDQKTCTFWKWNKNLIMKTISKGENGRDTHCLNFSETMLWFLFRVSDISSQSLLKKTHSPLLDENPLAPFTHWTFQFPSYWIQAQQVSITAWSHFPRSVVYSLVGSGCLIHSRWCWVVHLSACVPCHEWICHLWLPRSSESLKSLIL